MDELQISGKRFISARRIARENGYTSDYIGQLIRGGKIVGQKVGRAWYVDASSFERYLGSEAAEASISTEAETSAQEEIIEAPVQAEEAVSEKDALVLAQQEESPEEPEESLAEAEPLSAQDTSPESMEEESEVSAEEAPVIGMTPVVASDVVEEKESEISETPVVAHKVSLRISKKEAVVKEVQSAGLRYYADDVPILPELKKQEREVFSAVSAEQEYGNREAGEISKNRGSSKARTYATGLALVGITVFVLSAFFSSALSLNLSITEENTAAASYSITW
jgi:hypothetical protein